MLCRSHSHGTIIGLRALPVYKAPAALRIASPQEGVVIHSVTPVTFPVFLHCPLPQTMTVPSVDQVVTAIDQLQSIVELVSCNWTYIRGRIPQSIRPQISTSYKQSRDSWITTQDSLNRLRVLVLQCSTKDFDTGSELQQLLGDLQR
jgi:hypothetical protein